LVEASKRPWSSLPPGQTIDIVCKEHAFFEADEATIVSEEDAFGEADETTWLVVCGSRTMWYLREALVCG
jgi:hypothetical protein